MSFDKRVTLSGRPPAPGMEESGAPQPIKSNGQHADYWVLSAEERAKGWVRPLRASYVHIGPPGPKYPLRDLTAEEKDRYDQFGYIKYEEYPDGSAESADSLGKYWTEKTMAAVDKGCGTETRMSAPLAETYARDPKFYGATFCVTCGKHLPVAEFVWSGTAERVGS